jgi:dienelactone hydrolase
MRRLVLAGVLAVLARAEDFPKGQIIDEVKCAADASETYALYLPSNYSPDRAWSVILAFDPLARGRAPLVQYQAAAEQYGYIVAGSNNSKNGPWAISLNAAQAMLADVGSRFSVDSKRMYATGLSGGARVSMALALSTGKFAGVIASSAGFPDSRPRTSLDFPVFATAGSGDFNYLEMRRLDRVLTSPHRLVIFDGGHAWPPSDVAVEAVEWLEIQAMKSGLRGRDEAFLDKIFTARKAQLERASGREAYVALSALVADFSGLRDVQEFSARADALSRDKDVQKALKDDRAQDQHEQQLNKELAELAAGIDNPATRRDNLEDLRSRLTKLAKQARSPDDSPERQLARRAVWTLIVDNSSRQDPELNKLLKEVRPTDRP